MIPFDFRPFLSNDEWDTPDLRITETSRVGERRISYWCGLNRLFISWRIGAVPVCWLSVAKSPIVIEETLESILTAAGRRDDTTVDVASDSLINSLYDHPADTHDCLPTDATLEATPYGQVCIPCVVQAVESGTLTHDDIPWNDLASFHETHLHALLDQEKTH